MIKYSVVPLTFLFCLPLHADIVSYSDALAENGECVDYLDITEDATVNTGGTGLFGNPTRSGDTLIFNPMGFDAGPINGIGADLVDSHIETTICVTEESKPNGILNINVGEFGDYTVNGNGEVSSSINWFLDVPGATGIASGTTSFSATSGTGTWQLEVAIDLVNGTYDSGSGMMPLTDANGNSVSLPSDFIGCATLEFDNTLSSRSLDATSSAFIKKKGTGGVQIETVTNCAVPEPGSVCLLMLGMMGFFKTVRVSRIRR